MKQPLKSSGQPELFSYEEPLGKDTLYFEQQARASGFRFIAGVDEAGRGPLAGPLVVAACILPEGYYVQGVDDSKKLTPRQRQHLYAQIVNHSPISYAIEVVEPDVIDELNIFRATLEGMKRAVESLTQTADFILVDGSHTPFDLKRSKAIVKGDSLSHSIACASILAKVTRDAIMEGHDQMWPGYGFAKHKGYPTKDHIRALNALGPCSIHRRSYAPVRAAYQESSSS